MYQVCSDTAAQSRVIHIYLGIVCDGFVIYLNTTLESSHIPLGHCVTCWDVNTLQHSQDPDTYTTSIKKRCVTDMRHIQLTCKTHQ